MQLDLKALALPFPTTQISWRCGATTHDKTKAIALAYLDARDVMERLDDVCGVGGWQATYPHAGQKTVCNIGILVGEHWVWKANGAGDTDIEGEKGALSDAFKRAAVLWGVGRYLYAVPNVWVAIEKKGNSYAIKESETPRLLDVLAKVAAGLAVPKEPYPADPDALAGARKWTSEQNGLLSSYANDEDVRAWNTRNAKALQKLKGASEPLYEEVMKSYGVALERTRRAAA